MKIMITNTSARPMCETSILYFFLSLHLVLLLPPYQKAGYATDEPLQKKKIVSPLWSLPPPPPIQKCFRRACMHMHHNDFVWLHCLRKVILFKLLVFLNRTLRLPIALIFKLGAAILDLWVLVRWYVWISIRNESVNSITSKTRCTRHFKPSLIKILF